MHELISMCISVEYHVYIIQFHITTMKFEIYTENGFIQCTVLEVRDWVTSYTMASGEVIRLHWQGAWFKANGSHHDLGSKKKKWTRIPQFLEYTTQ